MAAPVSPDKTAKRIENPFCSCKAGVLGQCAHVLAVIMTLRDWILDGLKEIPAQPACTSQPQQWDKPRGAKIEPEPVATMVISCPNNVNRKRKPLIADFNDNRKIQVQERDIALLQQMHGTPLSYLAAQPYKMVDTPRGEQTVGGILAYQMPLLQDLEEPMQPKKCGDLIFPKLSNIPLPPVVTANVSKWGHLQVSHSQAVAIETSTRAQVYSPMWHDERQTRFTASNFARLMLRKANFSSQFINSILFQKKFSSPATSYGSCNEKVAVNMYRKISKKHVHDCGLIINPAFPLLGASPGGKVCDHELEISGILEVKCPFSAHDLMISEAVERLPNICLTEEDGKFILKRKHPYWYQVQGQLPISAADFCDFIIYTRKDFNIERIYPELDTMKDMLEKLGLIYCNYVAGKV